MPGASTMLIAATSGLAGLPVGWAIARVTGRLALEGDEPRTLSRLRDPAIIVAAGALGVWAGVQGDGWVMAAVGAVLAWQLLTIALVDGENFWLPDGLTLPLIATGIGAAALGGRQPALMHLIGAAAGFVSLWLIGRLYRRLRGREGLGGGDPFLFAGAGAWVGWTGLPSVLLWASAAGLSVVLAMLAVRRAVSGHDRLPFGVFLAVGIWMTWVFGPVGLSVP